MTRFALALIAATALTHAAFAAEDPATIKGANDTRIRAVDYSESKVIRITSTDLVPVTIVFGEGQLTKMISGLKVIDATPKDGATQDEATKKTAEVTQALTDSGGPIWSADRTSNELTLQPVREDPGSMLLVTTEGKDAMGNDKRYHYAFELHTRTGVIADSVKGGKTTTNYDPEAYFRVSYTYSADERAKKLSDWREAHKNDASKVQADKVRDQLELAQFGGNRNYKWNKGNSAACAVLSPDRISDNGQFTVLHFGPNTPISIPDRWNLQADKAEGVLPWHPQKAPDGGDLMVLETVPQAFILVNGDKSCLYTRDPNAPWQPVPATGTSSPDVVRETRR